MTRAAAIAFALLLPSLAFAQRPPAITPLTQTAGTVTTGGTFQAVLAANPERTSCLLQNTSTHIGYVYLLTSGTPTLLNTLQLAAGAIFKCNDYGGSVARGAILYTTSTTADPFVVVESQ